MAVYSASGEYPERGAKISVLLERQEEARKEPVVQKQVYKSLTVVHKQLYSLTENAEVSVILGSGTEASITPGRGTEACVILDTECRSMFIP